MGRGSRRALLAALLAVCASPLAAPTDDALLAKLRSGGHVLLVRHSATAQGLGDPPGLRIEDCATQRNLSEEGREQAKRLGEFLRKERIPIARVYNSPWCRCRDTATIAFGSAEDWAPLSSFFDLPHRELEYSESVQRRIASYAVKKAPGNVVMVTHNVNIAALTKLSVAPGEVVVVRPDGCCHLKVVGRLNIE